MVISLAPADIKKEGTAFDLGMAVGYLLASGNADFETEKKIFIGELSLEGNLRKTKGVLAMIRASRMAGFESAFVPVENALEAALVPGIKIIPIDSLKQLTDHLSGRKIIGPQTRTKIMARRNHSSADIDFGMINGQENAKRAMEIAAAGRHNVAMYGPPGTGKTMLAKAFAGILPTLTHEEVLEVTEIYSIMKTSEQNSGGGNGNIVTSAPFRAPHHTSPYSAIIGGGVSSPKPGEITFAHRGVIFLDEFTEFDRRTIDSLRQPMEEKKITITRTKESVTYPADCIYILAMNPCACGGKNCTCTDKEILRYRKKISGPIADRIDIWISVSKIEYENLSETAGENKNSSAVMAERVKRARLFKKSRPNIAKMDQEALSFFTQSAKKLGFSGRAYARTADVAATIANLAQSEEIKKEHVMEALQYRKRD